MKVRPFDPDQIESDALDFTIKTVRKLSDPDELKRELVRFVHQRMTKKVIPQQTDLLDRTLPLSPSYADKGRSTHSVEEVVEDAGRRLTERGRKMLRKVLYKRDGETLSMDEKQKAYWHRHVLPVLKEWAGKEVS